MTGTLNAHPRVGCVQYLNARPLVQGWRGDILFDHPNRLCELLAERKVDVALVSSFEFLRTPGYLLVDDVSVSSRGAVYSVFVAHKGELSEIEEIEIDPASRTSVNLLKCLLAEGNLTPRLIPKIQGTERQVRPGFAKFFIGDQAIRFRQRHASTLRFFDLGLEWEKRTGLPFVYAVWLIRPEAKVKQEVADALRKCRDTNLNNLESVIAGQTEFSPDFCDYYLRQLLRYDLGPEGKRGLSMFQMLCTKHQILPERGAADQVDLLLHPKSGNVI